MVSVKALVTDHPVQQAQDIVRVIVDDIVPIIDTVIVRYEEQRTSIFLCERIQRPLNQRFNRRSYHHLQLISVLSTTLFKN